jgi:hypothetical protein
VGPHAVRISTVIDLERDSSMNTCIKGWLIAACLGGTLSTAVHAQQPAPPAGGNVRAACRDDSQKLCPSVRPGGGRIKACMEAHKDQLSQPCRDALKAAAAKGPPSS